MNSHNNPLSVPGAFTPTGTNPQASKAQALLADINQTLHDECRGDPLILYTETKKLYLAVEEAESVRKRLLKHGKAVEPYLLRRELQYQLRTFAALKYLTDEEAPAIAALAEEVFKQQQDKHPEWSQTCILTQALERHTANISGDLLLEGVAIQPLARVMAQKEDVLEQLEPLLPYCPDICARFLYRAQQKLPPSPPLT